MRDTSIFSKVIVPTQTHKENPIYLIINILQKRD